MKLQVYKVDKGWVACSSEEIKPGDKYLFNQIMLPCLVNARDVGDQWCTNHKYKHECKKIVATSGFHIDGIPQWEMEANNLNHSSTIDVIGNCANCGVEYHIHRAAQSKGIYTKDDLIKAMLFAMRTREDSQDKLGKITVSDCTDEDDKRFVKESMERYNQGKTLMSNFIESLNQPKQLIAIEVEEETLFFTNALSNENVIASEGLRETSLTGLKMICSPEHPSGLLNVKRIHLLNINFVQESRV